MRSIKDVMLREKTVGFLLALDNNKKQFPYLLSRELNIGYCHLVKVCDRMVKEGLLKINKEGRTNYIKLTSKGLKVQENLIKLVKELSTPKSVGGLE